MTDDFVHNLPSVSSVHSRLAVAASRMEGGELNTLLNDAIREIERLRSERLEWFLVARDLRDAILQPSMMVDLAHDRYLRVRGMYEDPRD